MFDVTMTNFTMLMETTTDAQGRFAFDEVRDDEKLSVVVTANGIGWQIKTDIADRKHNHVLKLQPELSIEGEIRGDLNELAGERDNGRERRGDHWFVPLRYENSGVVRDIPVEMKNGKAHFESGALLPGVVVVRFGPFSGSARVGPKTPHGKIVIEIPVKR